MAYDSARGRTVLFGGKDVITFSGTNEVYGDTWEFDGATWQQTFPAHSPSARSGHTMTYDAGRGVTLLFGGLGRGGASKEVWEWNGSDWSLVTTMGASPGPRVGHGMAYDSARGVHVMYGGDSSSGALGDTWEYDGAGLTWTLRTPLATGPGARFWFQLAFDAARNRTLLFGGTPDATVQLADTWVWDGQAGVWTQLNPPAHPSERQFYTLSYDSIRELVVLQCGARVIGNSTSIDRETWEWDGNTWHDLTSAYSYCCPRKGAGMVYDSLLQQTVLFGGDGFDRQATWTLKVAWNGHSLYVDWQNSGTQDGSFNHPFQTVRQASDAASDCSILSIQAGDYFEGALILNKPLRLQVRNGQVQIH